MISEKIFTVIEFEQIHLYRIICITLHHFVTMESFRFSHQSFFELLKVAVEAEIRNKGIHKGSTAEDV